MSDKKVHAQDNKIIANKREQPHHSINNYLPYDSHNNILQSPMKNDGTLEDLNSREVDRDLHNHEYTLLKQSSKRLKGQRQKVDGSTRNLSTDPSEYNKDVPIYKLKNATSSFQAVRSNDNDACYAFGTLLGKFYETENNIKFQKVMFIGKFQGSVEYAKPNGIQTMYFQGNITQLVLILRQDKDDKTKQIFEKLCHEETSFRGFFKGNLYKWSGLPSIKDKDQLLNISFHELQSKIKSKKRIPNNDQSRTVSNNSQLVKIQPKEPQKQEVSYFVPSVMRFEVQDVREINLEKSMAVVSGYLHLQFKYTQEILECMKDTLQLKEEEKNRQKKQKIKNYKHESKLQLIIQFNRDFSLNLGLDDLLSQNFGVKAQEGDDDDGKSSSSEWSIQDKTWDNQSQLDQKQKIMRFKVWKRFNAEIDCSYGSYFAPFNLSILRIVVTVNSISLANKVKINIAGCDTLDYEFPRQQYDPFRPINDVQNETFFKNRLHQVNRLKSKDNGSYIIADNRLAIYPHFKNTLINKNTANDRWWWSLARQDKTQLLKYPSKVQSIPAQYEQFEQNWQKQRYTPFTFHKWSYFAIEIPIYKYIVIEMIQIFVPLFLLSIISLFIFEQSNGISSNSGFTTLSLRIVNVCSLMIAFVSLIPTLRQNLPPMPKVTFIQIITYIQTFPNLLALINSMVYYEINMSEWQSTYRAFRDWIFLISFILSAVCFLALIIVFVVYALKEYNVNYRPSNPKTNQKMQNEHQINQENMKREQQIKQSMQYRSPHYMQFMQEIIKKRREFKIQRIQIVK